MRLGKEPTVFVRHGDSRRRRPSPGGGGGALVQAEEHGCTACRELPNPDAPQAWLKAWFVWAGNGL